MVFAKIDFDRFKSWLDIDVNSIAWEGKFRDSFAVFWDSFFKENINISELAQRFLYAKRIAKSGPLISWINWLNDKFLVFCFVDCDMSVREMSLAFDLKERFVATVLRDHLVKVYPESEDFINEAFQISNVNSKNIFLKFKEIEEILGSEARDRGTFEDDILSQMEVTLYPDWPNLVKELRKDILSLKIDFHKIKNKLTFRKQLKFIQEVILLLIILSVIMFALKNSNKWYEDYLVDKITLFEPNFFWLDKSLSYQEYDLNSNNQIELSNKELDELEKIEAQTVFSDDQFNSRFDPESDVVVLGSVEEVPKSFLEAETEQSNYEENKKGGYRDSSYSTSNKKAYRILMSSVDPVEIKKKILPLIQQHKISQADTVRPGTLIPGGLYFNLHVPSRSLKEFIAKVSSFGEATIFESRSQGEDILGKNKVFIWIKSI
jgi:hypothetical protein